MMNRTIYFLTIFISISIYNTAFAWDVSKGRDPKSNRPYASLMQKADDDEIFFSLECQIGSLQVGIILPTVDPNEIIGNSITAKVDTDISYHQYLHLSIGRTSNNMLNLVADQNLKEPTNLIRYMLF